MRVSGCSSPWSFKRPEYTSRFNRRAFSSSPSFLYVIARLFCTAAAERARQGRGQHPRLVRLPGRLRHDLHGLRRVAQEGRRREGLRLGRVAPVRGPLPRPRRGRHAREGRLSLGVCAAVDSFPFSCPRLRCRSPRPRDERRGACHRRSPDPAGGRGPAPLDLQTTNDLLPFPLPRASLPCNSGY